MGPFRRGGRGKSWLTATTVGLGGVAIAGAVFISGVLPTQAQSVPRGATVYANNCQVCHGIKAEGGLGPPIIPIPDEILQAPRPEVVQGLTGLVRGGIPGAMPGFRPEQVSDADVAALVDYLIELNANQPSGRSFYDALEPVAAVPSTANRRYVAETQHTVSGAFKHFWERNGGARMFGNPISEEYTGYSPTGEPITMQLFERARLEYNASGDKGGEVQLSALGSAEAELRTYWLSRRTENGGN